MKTPTYIPDTPEDLRRARIKRRRDAETAELKRMAERWAATQRTDPHPGYWLVRLAKGGPAVAACIRVVQTTAEPDNPENDMAGARSPHLAAFVLDEPAALDRVWNWRGAPITEGEYKFQCAIAAWARKYSPDEPIANPRKRVELKNIPIPFLGQE